MLAPSIVRLVAFVACLIAPHVASADAVADTMWPVQGRLRAEDGGKSLDISGIACTSARFPRACLVIDDNRQSAQFVTVDDGRLIAGDDVKLIGNMFDGVPLDLDGEGVAFEGRDFYVMGSHGRPRHVRPGDEARALAQTLASSQIIRVRIKPGAGAPLTKDDVEEVRTTSMVRDVIAGMPTLAPFLEGKLDENGVTLEGIAIANGRMYAGFRGPVLPGGVAPVLSVALGSLFDGAAPEARLSKLALGPNVGVRDLAPWKDGLLVLAGPIGDEGPYSIYFWDLETERLTPLADISAPTQAGRRRKPEALLPLAQGPDGLRVLILFDNVAEGGPLPIVVPAP